MYHWTIQEHGSVKEEAENPGVLEQLLAVFNS